MSCMEPVTNNQRISVADIEAKEFREQVIEWLMTNHPHDCAVCDEGGWVRGGVMLVATRLDGPLQSAMTANRAGGNQHGRAIHSAATDRGH